MKVRRSITHILFEKQPAMFRSKFDLPESVQRVAKGVRRWPFVSPFRSSLVGKVKEDSVSIARIVPFTSNPFSPVFSGQFAVQNGVTVLHGSFSMLRYNRFHLISYFGMTLFMMTLTPFIVLSGAPIYSNQPVPLWQSQLFILFIPWACFIFGALFFGFFRWLTRNDVAIISQRIERALQAQDVVK